MSAAAFTLCLKTTLSQGRADLKSAFLLNQINPAQLLKQHAALVDSVLNEAWQAQQFTKDFCLIAVGGYGRSKLYPASDVDILILQPSATLQETETLQLEQFIGQLWDIGLEIGQSVRTIEECIAEAQKDVTVQTALLEARLIHGDAAQFSRFKTQRDAHLDPAEFFDAKNLEQQQRYSKFQGAVNKLEPNLKEAPGGLRDLHHIGWIALACHLDASSWQALAAQNLLTRQEARLLNRCERELQQLRIVLHYTAKRREDRLSFEYQTPLAQHFAFVDDAHKRASEKLMQDYYRTSRTVMQLNHILIQNFRQYIYSPMPSAPVILDAHFHIQNNLLAIRHPQVFIEHPDCILRLFVHWQQQHTAQGIAASTLRALWHARQLIKQPFRQNPINRDLFMQILREPRGVTRVLRRMNQYGILGRYLPAFGKIVGQMQHDLFHIYTVDEHILMVLRNLRRLAVSNFAHEYPLCTRLLLEFERPETLYIAALFHDIAKGRGGDHSELGRADARAFCIMHNISPADTDLIEWLVEKHLTMSAVAQKQDVYDPEVIANFASLVKDTRHLNALYLLTVADIRGTSPKVWNSWKAKLLESLWHATQRYLAGENFEPESYIECRQREARNLLKEAGIPAQAENMLWKELDSLYFLRHNKQEIAWHAAQLHQHSHSQNPIVRCRPQQDSQNADHAGIQVMIYGPDNPTLFAQICAFFDTADYTIAEAKIHTTKHGYALDSFFVLDCATQSDYHADPLLFIEQALSARLQNPIALAAAPSLGRGSRQVRHFPLEPTVQIQHDEKQDSFSLEIVAADRPGLLSRIAALLASHQIKIHSAKITTLGERAEDIFVITGGKLNNEKTEMRLQNTLLQTLRV